ncbi:hypothetical protein SAMN02745126_04814 [Enhydrobacter aerosaccus]|uniref:Uncharacterized protein n=1 Tax=Enhydrobacter aerosaccus TaxID=225324 RepID=A0A1T4SK46_9HYPH|nr:hypothetical protein [Enhydrobacter aerosaccus]SKA28664.1 hypothetical protein SAMN02745126_04814 [Enhydrobacter aerosaccus]
MTNIMKEFAKFFAGVAAMQTVFHWALGLSDVLPVTLVGITYTPGLNTTAMVAWPIIMVLLIYYAWLRRSAG